MGDCLAFPVNQQTLPSYRSVLSRDKRLPLGTWKASGPQENVFGNQFSTFDSPQNHYQGIHHSTTPSAAGSVTGRLVARDEDRNKGTIPMPTKDDSNTEICKETINPELFLPSRRNVST